MPLLPPLFLLAILAMAACQPMAAGPALPGGPTMPQGAPPSAPVAIAEPIHQGGVVFLTPPEGGFAVGGRVVDAGAGARAQLVFPDGKTVEAPIAAGGRFTLTSVPEDRAAKVAAVRIVDGERRHWVEHASGVDERRRWLRHHPGQAYDLGDITREATHAQARHNPLASHDTDGDGTADHLDLDDDGDGTPDREDRDDANHGIADDHDPAPQG